MSLRRLRIEWKEGHKVTARLAMPADPRDTVVLLAHGAGLGQYHPWMTRVRDGLAAAGYPTMTFDYPYMEAGRRSPGSLSSRLDCHRAALARLRTYSERIVLAGKSMGGRLASHVAAEGEEVAGLVYYGYPLVSPGRKEARDTGHLDVIGAPMLFVTGTRDRLCPLELLTPVLARLGAEAALIEGGDHGFMTPKSSGMSIEDTLDGVVTITADWIAANR